MQLALNDGLGSRQRVVDQCWPIVARPQLTGLLGVLPVVAVEQEIGELRMVVPVEVNRDRHEAMRVAHSVQGDEEVELESPEADVRIALDRTAGCPPLGEGIARG